MELFSSDNEDKFRIGDKVRVKYRRKGITLIALVVTIIILLILAGIGITVVINGGVIQQAQNASDKYKDAQ